MKAVIGDSFPFGGIGHDLTTNKSVEAGTVLDHGVSSLVSGMAAKVVTGALGCKGVHCGSVRGLFGFGINGISPSWGFCIEDLGISWMFVLDTLYTVNGIGAVGHFVDMAMGFVTRV